MSVTVEIVDPRHPEATALLKQSHALMGELFPAESCHFFSIDDLCQDNIRFFGAAREDRILGCGGIAIKHGYTEVKSMFVDPSARGLGLAEAILKTLIKTTKAEGHNQMYLETGDSLHAAHRLYEKFGFRFCDPFGDYKEDPYSRFMHLSLPD